MPTTVDGDAGPFGTISSEIIGKLTKERWILAPTYLSRATEIGYIKLDHASPAILNGRATKGVKDKVIEIMSLLRTAAQSARRQGVQTRVNFDLQSYVDLLPHVMFQTPATRLHFSPQGPSIYQVAFDEHLKNVRPITLTQKDFFYPLFEVTPRERCAFFRNSLRIVKDAAKR